MDKVDRLFLIICLLGLCLCIVGIYRSHKKDILSNKGILESYKKDILLNKKIINSQMLMINALIKNMDEQQDMIKYLKTRTDINAAKRPILDKDIVEELRSDP